VKTAIAVAATTVFALAGPAIACSDHLSSSDPPAGYVSPQAATPPQSVPMPYLAPAALRPPVTIPLSQFIGPQIPGLTGDASAIQGADTNPADFGNYPAGNGLIGGPLLNDLQAAERVVPTQKSNIETGPDAAANAAANNYFELNAISNPTDYLNQLHSLWSAYADRGWYQVIERVDGACPMTNPTTAMVAQWAANKWGINPLLLYAEATNESHWDQTGLGDAGCSSGILQVADCNNAQKPNHAFPGFSGAGANLARENTCFNADFYAAHLWAAFHGLTGETPAGDIGAAIQSWDTGNAPTAGSYTAQIYNILSNQGWISAFNGASVPF
jgi:hypothetical protein